MVNSVRLYKVGDKLWLNSDNLPIALNGHGVKNGSSADRTFFSRIIKY